MNRQKLEQILKQEPLFFEDTTRGYIDWSSLTANDNPALFFGVGMCTSKEPAVAIPFDLLAFFLLSEKLRRNLNLEKIFVLIADEHAKTNSFMTEKITKQLTSKMHATFTSIVRNLRLANFEIILSSDIKRRPEFISVLESTPRMANEYLRQEIADMIWFTSFCNVHLKLGWAINSDPNIQGHDERFFDAQIKRMETLPLSFIHTHAGRTFDPLKPKTSPYIATEVNSRIILAKDENVVRKLSFSKNIPIDVSRGAINHLTSIVRLFESLFIRIPNNNLEQKIQFIIDICCKN